MVVFVLWTTSMSKFMLLAMLVMLMLVAVLILLLSDVDDTASGD